MSQNNVAFDPEKFQEFKIAYHMACGEGEEVFVFEGNEFDTVYAKYLIEYLTNKLEK